jgi:hypothetical protein
MNVKTKDDKDRMIEGLKKELNAALEQNLELRKAIREFKRAKGRYNTETAARKLMEMEN